jgi:hypothetical protein
MEIWEAIWISIPNISFLVLLYASKTFNVLILFLFLFQILTVMYIVESITQ